jgi:ribosomal protein L11
MATSFYLRKQRKTEAVEQETQQTAVAQLTFAEKSKIAWQLVKNGKAENLSEAHKLIKNGILS